jgi:hypothetical protein
MCRVRNPFEWSCPRYRTGMVWTSHIDFEYGDLSSVFGYILSIRWLLSFLKSLSLLCSLLVVVCIYLIMSYLSIVLS